ncbi:hypothetical protein BJX64DRAFT_290934 [Aspergillus heterothallicus]
MRDDLGYTRGLKSLQRRLGYASGTITKPTLGRAEIPLLFHPGITVDELIVKLRTALYLSDGETISPEMPLIDLGIDSLIGVEVRTWLPKELAVDVRALKILGRASASKLAADVLGKLELARRG